MKKVTRIEVSFKEDFVPFLQRFKRVGGDVATIFFQESEKFLKNLNEDDTPAALRIYERLHNIVDPRQWVSGSFAWDDSTDGADFWEDIDSKWRQFLYEEEEIGPSEFVGVVTLSDVQSLTPKPIQGKYYTVRDLSYNRPVEKEFESCTWNKYDGSELTEPGGKYLILSDYPEDKKMGWINITWPRPMIKVWIPELNKAWWVFFSPVYISTE